MTPSLVRRGLIAAIIASVSIAGCKRNSTFNAAGCQSGDQCIADNGGLDRWLLVASQNPPAGPPAAGQPRPPAPRSPRPGAQPPGPRAIANTSRAPTMSAGR